MKLMSTLVMLFIFSSCATIMNGRKEMVPIKTNPEGATAEINGHKCTTPCSIELTRGHNYVLRITKKGYKSKKVDLFGKSADGWLWGNLLLGGIIGLGVDYGTGAAYDFEPEFVFKDLEPVDRKMTNGSRLPASE